MRTDQCVGLNERAKAIIVGEPVSVVMTVTREYPDGWVTKETNQVFESTVKSEVYRTLDGAWNPGFLKLFKYTFPDGRILYEDVQAEPWSSGPVYFLALRDSEYSVEWNWIPDSLWTDEEIERNT